MPEISVIIPVFNVEEYLRECLDSIRAQTFSDFEVICVDDGSTDSSPAILKEYAEKDPRFKVITPEKQGLPEARNTGADAAAGKYLYFMDGDDRIEPVLLGHCYETAEKYLAETLYFSCYAKHKFTNPENDPRFREVYSGRDLLLLTKKLNCWHPTIWVRFFLRDFYVKHALKFQSGICYEDLHMVMESDLLPERAVYLPERLYHYRARQGSICNSPAAFHHFYSRWQCCRKLHKLFLKYVSCDEELAVLYSEWLQKNIRLLRDHYIDMTEEERKKTAEHPEIAETLALLELILQSDLKIKDLYLENDILRSKLDFVLHHSISYKIGRIVTYLPKKIVNFLKGNKNG